MLYNHTAKIENNYCAAFARDWEDIDSFQQRSGSFKGN